MITEVKEYIKTWQNRCYPELPDEAPKEIDNMVPSYKRIAMAIMRGDLKLIGITPPKSEWYGILKRIELNERSKTMHDGKMHEQAETGPNDLLNVQQTPVAGALPNEGCISNKAAECKATGQAFYDHV